jgi:TM2 domain-containing membrane protein YozV
MERFWLSIISFCFIASLCFGQEMENKNLAQKTDSSSVSKSDSITPEKRAFNPVIALTSSAILPGAGQVYTGHYVKAGLFLAASVFVGLYAYQRYNYELDLKTAADKLADSVALYRDTVWIKSGSAGSLPDTSYPAIGWQLETDLARFDVKDTRYAVYQGLAWLAGIYYYNLLDALRCSGFLHSDTKKNPALAGWLSAIPGLGLGQIYNGELSKAGMILMTQFNLLYMAYNANRLMNDCENYETALGLERGTPENKVFNEKYKDKWESRRDNAFKNRNMFLWYSLMFYFYGVFDAVVDAHLHDSRTKMRLEPDLVPQQKAAGAHVTIRF